jgi:hypothetical protein
MLPVPSMATLKPNKSPAAPSIGVSSCSWVQVPAFWKNP